MSLFHLNNREANQELTVNFCSHRIKHDKSPIYLGITLDLTLTYNHHLEKIAPKLKTRIALISKLAGTSWGANTQVIRTSTIALFYSVAEYFSSVCKGSTHCKLIDIELWKSLCIITGTVKSTKLQRLPVLANIELPNIRWQNTVLPIAAKIQNNLALTIHENGVTIPRLKSCHPFFAKLEVIKDRRSLQPNPWKEEWESDISTNGFFVDNVHSKPPGSSDFPRKLLTRLNRIRAG